MGKAVASYLRARDHEVIALSRNPIDISLQELGVVEIYDPTWPSCISTSGIGQEILRIGIPDVVIHLAGNPNYGNGPQYFDDNRELTRSVINLMQTYCPSSRIVYASSVGAQDFPKRNRLSLHNESTVPLPRSDYGKSKLEAESLIKNSGLSHCIARIGMVTGPHMREASHVLYLAKKTKAPVWRSLALRVNGILPLVHVNDVASAIYLMATSHRANGIYLVVAINIRIADLVAKIHDVMCPRFQLDLGSLAMVLPAKIQTAVSPVMGFDSSRLRELGWIPTTSLSDLCNAISTRLESPSRDCTVVTGAASGLGRAIAITLVNRGIHVIGVDVNQAGLTALERDHPEAAFLCMDITDPRAFANIVALGDSKGWSVSSLVLAAGVGRKVLFQDQDWENIKSQVDINLLSRLKLSHDFITYRKHLKGRFQLVLVGSSTAIQPLGAFAVYSSTNAAVVALGRALIAETPESFGQITVLIPGGMDTNFQNSAGVRRFSNEQLLDPNDVAKRLLRKQKKSRVIIVGRNARIFLVLSRLLPQRFLDRLWTNLVRFRR